MNELRNWTPEQLESVNGKTYVITGTTSGAGFEATRLLLSKGAKVVMLNRNADKSATVIRKLKQEFGSHADVAFIQMDLASLASVRQAGTKVLETVPHIDALICNAAIAQVPKLVFTEDGFESQLGVNYLADFLLCGLLFDRIEQSGGRIVVVSSLAYKRGLRRIRFEDLNFENSYSGWDAYAQSKLALMLFSYELQRRLNANGKKARIYVCHPGASRTNLQDSFGLRDRIIWGIMKWIIAQPAQRGAWSQVMCATQEGLKQEALYGPSKRGDTVGPVGENKLDPIALDKEAAARLWNISEEMTGFRWTF